MPLLSTVKFFAQRPFVANVIMFGLILSSIFFWDIIGKEERPEFSMNWVRASIPYPGASAEDVELFVIKPIEEQLKGISGLYEVNSTARFGRAQFRVTVDPDIKDFKEKYQEIKDAIDRAELPTETEDPTYGRFNSSEKAIMDIALYLEGYDILTVEQRQSLQEYALTFKNQLLSLPEVSGVEAEGYLKPELQIKVNPDKLIDYELPLAEVASQIQSQHIRTPLGVMEDKTESEVALRSYLDNIPALNSTVIRNSFQGVRVLLSDIAHVNHGFERTTSLRKVQGHEAVVFNVQKSQGVGILKAREATMKLADRFIKHHGQSNIRMKILDDESYDVRNRLSIISSNGFVGFLIILFVLFFFLDFRSGFWVAMGLPFSLAFTLLACILAGYTVNNITLAAIIIVLGIVVDDAIIVADNIAKAKQGDGDQLEKTARGTLRVFLPVVAGILTTCVAFVPLLFFEGRFGMFTKYIPLVVCFMLIASLFESFFILPSHLMTRKMNGSAPIPKTSWDMGKIRIKIMSFLEGIYSNLLMKVLKWRWPMMMALVVVLGLGYFIFSQKLNYVMFPREEPKEFAVKVVAQEGTTRKEMAELTKKVEALFLEDKFKSVVGFRTVIGESRRGGQVHENVANLRVEILPPSETEVPASEMMDYWEKQAKAMPEFTEVRFLQNWWSSSSGSPIAIEILENKDDKRERVTQILFKELQDFKSLANVEIEKPIVKTEYGLELNRQETLKLQMDAAQLARTLRAYIEGQILYRLYTDEEIDVRLTSHDGAKNNIEQILDLRATNGEGYMVPIKQLVELKPQKKPVNIQRVNYKRANYIYADLADGTSMTPLEIAEHLENNVFPELAKESPTTLLNFRGEIEDSRDSQSDFKVSIIMTLALIYMILTFMFGSLTMPFVIGSVIPFGMVGVALAFWSHGMEQYGFFAVVGVIGMLGVVINDSIVMVDCFETELKEDLTSSNLYSKITQVAVTRLRPVLLTTLTTVAGVFPTAYGIGGYDAMLADMMLALGWGLIFGTAITLVVMPIIYSFIISARMKVEELV